MDLATLFDLLRSPDTTQIRRKPMSATLQAAPSISEARASTTPWRQSLDGEWAFRLERGIENVGEDWCHSELAQTQWDRIEVPGFWTRQNFGDQPTYTNAVMPWKLHPPDVPDDTTVGLYRRTFQLPQSWQLRRTVIHFGAVESAFGLYCNNRFVGLGKDSRLPSEFDISDYLHTGSNEVAVIVLRSSDGSWTLDQDHWSHGGIHRSVYLESRGLRHVRDVAVSAQWDSVSSVGTLKLECELNKDVDPGWRVEVCLETKRGRKIVRDLNGEFPSFRFGDPITEIIGAEVYEGPRLTLEVDDVDVGPWSAESPIRYRLTLQLINSDGDIVEAHAIWVGFRSVMVHDGQLLINDQPVLICGMNRHDHHPVTGKTLTEAGIRAELVTMKRNNVNAIRTAHYPNDPKLLDLCDELGIYVIDEANIESHGRLESLVHDDRYFHAMLERVRRMVIRDRNHVSVIGWSLGNESGYGTFHHTAAAWIRSFDPTRIVQYEGVFHRCWNGDPQTEASRHSSPSREQRQTTDVVCPMYPSVDMLKSWAEKVQSEGFDDRPLIMCEYSHSMGNSNGGLSEYFELFRKHRHLQGGFIWDWRDQGLAETGSMSCHQSID